MLTIGEKAPDFKLITTELKAITNEDYKGTDFNRTVSRAFDTLFEDDFMGLTGFSKRSAYVIDKEGNLQYSEVTDGKSLPDFDKIKEVLKQL